MLKTLTDLDREPTRLASSRLAVEIAAPVTVYRGARFDAHGFVSQVTLDGAHTFCVPESYIPGQGTGGQGICNEFSGPLMGYDEAKVGDLYPKLGIGLLRRQDEGGHNVFIPQDIVTRFPVSLESTADQATFVVEPLDCRGYAIREEKTLSVRDNWLTINYRLTNVGTRPFQILEYMHNFIGIDRQLIGPDYVLSLPYDIHLEPDPHFNEPGLVQMEGHTFHFARTPKADFYCRPMGTFKTDQPQWDLRCLSTGAGLREYVDFAPRALAVWGTTHVLSAEVFIAFDLQPGESQAWTRRFEFFAAPESQA